MRLSTCACPLCMFTICFYCDCPVSLFRSLFTSVYLLLLSIDSMYAWPFTMSIRSVCSMSLFSESVLNESILCVRSLFISTISVYCACQLGPFTASGHFFYLCTMSVSRVYPMILFSASFQMSPFCVRPMCLSTASSIGGRFAHLQEGSSFYLVITSLEIPSIILIFLYDVTNRLIAVFHFRFLCDFVF